MKDCVNLQNDRPLSRADRFNRFYLTVVIAVGTGMAFSVMIAILLDVLIGLITAVISGVFYHILKTMALSRFLGLTLRIGEKGLCITSISAQGATRYTLPHRLMWLDVTELDDGVLKAEGNESLTTLTLPDTLTRISPNALSDAPALSTLRFRGNADAFAALTQGMTLSTLRVITDVSEEPPLTPAPPTELEQWEDVS